jgi:uncharacterized protein YgbK (DUF1537 family)
MLGDKRPGIYDKGFIMKSGSLSLSDTLHQLPPEWPEDLLPEIQEIVRQSGRKLVVLDDDPTGSQSVHSIPVLTEWNVGSLTVELKNDLPAFYILTNSRSLEPKHAEALNREIGCSLAEASSKTGVHYAVVSRGDSTLRGHFPGEVHALEEGLNDNFNAWILIPALPSAGRYTIHDIHYVAEADQLIPVGQSTYAMDATFGFQSSDLKKWVEEKTSGQISSNDVISISIDDIRTGGPARVQTKLMGLRKGSVCVMNAASRRDLEVLSLALLKAEGLGRRFLYRTGPSFVPVRIGLNQYPLLNKDDLGMAPKGGGLIIVGSYVPKTSSQVEQLLQVQGITTVEIDVEKILQPDACEMEITRASNQADEAIRNGMDAVVYTSRKLITGADAGLSLQIGQKVSQALVSVLRGISTRPRYVLAKGGITSSDIATQGLEVKRAIVLGQIFTGVSVWQLGPETRWEGLPYLVFPGNVGGPEALAEVVTKLKS